MKFISFDNNLLIMYIQIICKIGRIIENQKLSNENYYLKQMIRIDHNL